MLILPLRCGWCVGMVNSFVTTKNAPFAAICICSDLVTWHVGVMNPDFEKLPVYLDLLARTGAPFIYECVSNDI